MVENQRYEYRILADLVVEDLELGCPGSQKVKGAIRELSASGCRLESSVDLKINQELKMSFQLAGEHYIQNARARVVRRLSQRTHKVVAVKFVDLPETEQYKIREFVVWKEAQEAAS